MLRPLLRRTKNISDSAFYCIPFYLIRISINFFLPREVPAETAGASVLFSINFFWLGIDFQCRDLSKGLHRMIFFLSARSRVHSNCIWSQNETRHHILSSSRWMPAADCWVINKLTSLRSKYRRSLIVGFHRGRHWRLPLRNFFYCNCTLCHLIASHPSPSHCVSCRRRRRRRRHRWWWHCQSPANVSRYINLPPIKIDDGKSVRRRVSRGNKIQLIFMSSDVRSDDRRHKIKCQLIDFEWFCCAAHFLCAYHLPFYSISRKFWTIIAYLVLSLVNLQLIRNMQRPRWRNNINVNGEIDSREWLVAVAAAKIKQAAMDFDCAVVRRADSPLHLRCAIVSINCRVQLSCWSLILHHLHMFAVIDRR